QYMAVAKAMPSSSHGTAATRWSLQEAVVGQKNSPMAHLKVRYASKAATTFPLSPADWLLLQQPVKARWNAGPSLIHGSAGFRPRRRFRVRRWSGSSRWGRRGLLAPVAAPGVLGELSLAANGEIVVAIGELCDHRTRNASIGLGHEALQFGGAAGEVLPLRLKPLAIPEFVLRGIGKCRL